ncbi:putative membrane protein YeiH [Rhodobium orientis]|uniref:GlsB/YeaQ/YmgE family stress response membrane protein n=1 Tax=Rhodobium orientis TaxID=34017 RepID=A0A327JL20_9HYPH|nr:hypothetical protein [Rhodobium orientis]MBB4303599.1 putative membrane protein YeiH [Rhodobium orientis]MBK5951945.1 hypothetical protein [Rhodobium orientis]RAI26791.1 hypothetical protein CH339_12930 [Rhodobium orientis]
MLDSFSSGDFITLMILLFVASVAIGWITDSILGSLGFGMIGNAVLSFAGASAAIFLLDKAIVRHWLPIRIQADSIPLWIGAASAGALAMILLPLLLRRVIRS